MIRKTDPIQQKQPDNAKRGHYPVIFVWDEGIQTKQRQYANRNNDREKSPSLGEKWTSRMKHDGSHKDHQGHQHNAHGKHVENFSLPPFNVAVFHLHLNHKPG